MLNVPISVHFATVAAEINITDSSLISHVINVEEFLYNILVK